MTMDKKCVLKCSKYQDKNVYGLLKKYKSIKELQINTCEYKCPSHMYNDTENLCKTCHETCKECNKPED